MGSSTEQSGAGTAEKKYKGVRRRKWGKWVSEIRVPGSQERLWLGSYATPEAAAVAHDVAFYCLRRPLSLDALNFPELLPASVSAELSPKSVQRAASDAGMEIDALIIVNKSMEDDDMTNVNGVIQGLETQFWEGGGSDFHYGTWKEQELSISVEDYDYIS